MSVRRTSDGVTYIVHRDVHVDIDIYGRGLASVSGSGAEAEGRPTALKNQEQPQDARPDQSLGSNLTKQDLCGHEDSRISGTDAHSATAAQVEDGRGTSGNRTKRSFGAILIPVKRKVKDAMKRLVRRFPLKSKKSKEASAQASSSSVTDKAPAKSPGVSTAVTSDKNTSKTKELTEFEAAAIDAEESLLPSRRAENTLRTAGPDNILHGSPKEIRKKEGPSFEVSEMNSSSSLLSLSDHGTGCTSYSEAEIVDVEWDSFNKIPELLSASHKSMRMPSATGVSKGEETEAGSLMAINWKRRSASNTASKESSPNGPSSESHSTEQVPGYSSSKSFTSESTNASEISSEVEVVAIEILEVEPDGFRWQEDLEREPGYSENNAAELESGETLLKGDNGHSRGITMAVSSKTLNERKAPSQTDQSDDERGRDGTERHVFKETACGTVHEASNLRESQESLCGASVGREESIAQEPSSWTSTSKSSGSVYGDFSAFTEVESLSEIDLTQSESATGPSSIQSQAEARANAVESHTSSQNHNLMSHCEVHTEIDARGSTSKSPAEANEGSIPPVKGRSEVAIFRGKAQLDNMSGGTDQENVSGSEGEPFYDALESVDCDYFREASTSSAVTTTRGTSEMEVSEVLEFSSSTFKRFKKETEHISWHSLGQSMEVIEISSDPSDSNCSPAQESVAEEGVSLDGIFLSLVT